MWRRQRLPDPQRAPKWHKHSGEGKTFHLRRSRLVNLLISVLSSLHVTFTEPMTAFEIILAAFDICLETLDYFRKSRRWPCPFYIPLPEMLFPSQSLTIVTRGGREGGGSGRKELVLFSEKEAVRAGDRKKGQMGDGKERERVGRETGGKCPLLPSNFPNAKLTREDTLRHCYLHPERAGNMHLPVYV